MAGYYININKDRKMLTSLYLYHSLLTSFCAGIYGMRRCERKTETIIMELKNDS